MDMAGWERDNGVWLIKMSPGQKTIKGAYLLLLNLKKLK